MLIERRIIIPHNQRMGDHSYPVMENGDDLKPEVHKNRPEKASINPITPAPATLQSAILITSSHFKFNYREKFSEDCIR